MYLASSTLVIRCLPRLVPLTLMNLQQAIEREGVTTRQRAGIGTGQTREKTENGGGSADSRQEHVLFTRLANCESCLQHQIKCEVRTPLSMI